MHFLQQGASPRQHLHAPTTEARRRHCVEGGCERQVGLVNKALASHRTAAFACEGQGRLASCCWPLGGQRAHRLGFSQDACGALFFSLPTPSSGGRTGVGALLVSAVWGCALAPW